MAVVQLTVFGVQHCYQDLLLMGVLFYLYDTGFVQLIFIGAGNTEKMGGLL